MLTMASKASIKPPIMVKLSTEEIYFVLGTKFTICSFKIQLAVFVI